MKPTTLLLKLFWCIAVVVVMNGCSKKQEARKIAQVDTSWKKPDLVRYSLSNWKSLISYGTGRIYRTGILRGGLSINFFDGKRLVLSRDTAKGYAHEPFFKGNGTLLDSTLVIESIYADSLEIRGQAPTITLTATINSNKTDIFNVSTKNSSLKFAGLTDDTSKVFLIGCNFKKSISLDGRCTTLHVFETSFENLHSVLYSDSIALINAKFNQDNTRLIGKFVTLDQIDIKGTLTLQRENYYYKDVNVSTVVLKNLNLDQLMFPEYGMNFIVDTNQSYAIRLRLLNQLTTRFATVPEEKKKYDIQRLRLIDDYENNWLSGFIAKNWNNYGYDKSLIFRNAIILMLFFYLINLMFYRKLLFNGYVIEEFSAADYKLSSNGKLPWWKIAVLRGIYCFFYTCFIFWGLKLSVEKIKVTNLALSAWILLQYIVGIICLGYIANIIITKA